MDGTCRCRRRPGQGAGAPSLQDRQDRRPGPGRTRPAQSGARDLAAHPGGPRRSGTSALAPPPGPSPGRPQEPHPRHPHRLRASLPRLRPLWRRRPPAPRGNGHPEPWRSDVTAGLQLIDQLAEQIGACEAELRRAGGGDPVILLLKTVPGIGDVLAFTIVAEIGVIRRFRSPKQLCGYTDRTTLPSDLILPRGGDREMSSSSNRHGSRVMPTQS